MEFYRLSVAIPIIEFENNVPVNLEEILKEDGCEVINTSCHVEHQIRAYVKKKDAIKSGIFKALYWGEINLRFIDFTKWSWGSSYFRFDDTDRSYWIHGTLNFERGGNFLIFDKKGWEKKPEQTKKEETAGCICPTLINGHHPNCSYGRLS